jgi:dipeptidyl aminopeptidase/acylaminoacyl peptidase
MYRTLSVLIAVVLSLLAADGYRKPPREILDVLHAPLPPVLTANPLGTHALLGWWVRYPSLADVSRPFLGLAGIRFDPATSGPQLLQYCYELRLKDLSSGSESPLALPPDAKLGVPSWSPDGKVFVVTNTTADRIQLLAGDVATGTIRPVPGVALNNVVGTPFSWINSRSLLVKTVPPGRGKPPAKPEVPSGPVIQEGSGQSGPVRTFQDMITSPYEEDLFEYYAASQIATVDLAAGKLVPVGKPAIFSDVEAAPDGKHILVSRIHRPFSYLHYWELFPRDVEVWDVAGRPVHTVAKLPLADRVPIEGVPTGPREVRWFAPEPATVIWTEALDDGDPRKKVQHRDRLMLVRSPFSGEPVEIVRTQHRLVAWAPLEGSRQALVTDFDRDRRWTQTLLADFGKPGGTPRELWSRNVNDRYGNPGNPVMKPVPSGQAVVAVHRDGIFLAGAGASPEGDRPFLDRMSLDSLKKDRLYRSGTSEYEAFVALSASDGSRFITRRESPAEPPNYFLRSASGESKAITEYADPTPQLRRIRKQLVRYKRADGVDLSFTLYLPPDYKEGTRLPIVLFAYPLEFTDPGTAGQVTGSPQRFTTIYGISHLFYVLAGYAVLDNAAMPVVGDPETVNNTYVEQISASAKAAIDKAAEMGVADPARVGAIGHSYGAFMTANLLAHTDLFKAGVARSGAYNRTLTPFGFQSERRTYWQAPDVYLNMSPFHHAHKINEPLLLIHGQADDNAGTFPIQSERLYHAVRGNGGTVRLVMLPHESHGYRARESVEHTLYEMISWFDKYVKNAK